MTQHTTTAAPKKSVNLSINSALLSEARSLKLNLSATLESALAVEVRKVERERWLESNRKAIDSANSLAEKSGLFSDLYRVI